MLQTFTLSQLVVAVVVTHIVTLLFYVLLGAVCYWTRCAHAETEHLSVGYVTLLPGDCAVPHDPVAY